MSLSCLPHRGAVSLRDPVRFGIVTDCHYADTDPSGTRFSRESLSKLSECVARMNAEKVNFLIELGDFKDQNRPPMEQQTLSYLDRIEGVFRQFRGARYHVLGNHDMDSLSKGQFLARVENPGIDPRHTWYSFTVKGLHCVVLDANYRADGEEYDHGNFKWTDANIPMQELDWLRRDLAGSRGPAIVFVHQLLDGRGDLYVKNAAEVRNVLEKSGKVLAVFQGHHHPGQCHQIGGIHYYTLRALVEGQGEENNAYAIVEVRPGRDVTVTGYRKAETRQLLPGTAAQPGFSR